ncbi:MAG: hypothetical protein ACYDH1_10590 [Anaerolineaceae bacterium]
MDYSDSLIPWLLSSKIPTIRFKTYRNLLGYDLNDPTLIKEYREIQTSFPVQDILDRQVILGQWPYLNHYYTPKYVSTHWSMMLLEELLIDPQDARFQKAVEFMLNSTQADIQKRLDFNNPGFTCLWGNILRYVIYGGFINDPRTQDMITVVTKSLTETECKCEINKNVPCSWGLVRSLCGLSAIPPEKRTSEINEAIQVGLEFLFVKNSVVKSNYPLADGAKTHPLWGKISFPLFYQSDILHILRVLIDLNQVSLPQAQPAIQWLQFQQKSNGRIRGSNPYHRRTWPIIAEHDDIDRWVTLYALEILNKAELAN